jgi:NTE family protein
VPTRPLREMGAGRVLAVHLKGSWTNNGDGPRHLFDVIGQCFAIAQDVSSNLWKQAADLVLEPDVNGYKYDDFEHSPTLVRAGEIAARNAMPEIRRWLKAELQRSHARKRVAQTVALPAD